MKAVAKTVEPWIEQEPVGMSDRRGIGVESVLRLGVSFEPLAMSGKGRPLFWIVSTILSEPLARPIPTRLALPCLIALVTAS